MNNFAIWYQGQKDHDKQSDVELDIHFNFWKLRTEKNKKFDYLLDVGLMVYGICNVKEIYFFCPFKKDYFDVFDLGNLLINNQKLIDLVFNENYNITNLPNKPKQIQIKKLAGNNTPLFHIYGLDIDNKDIIKRDNFNGTVLCIPIDKFSLDETCDTYYFRFRLKGDAIKNLVIYHKPKNWFFQSAFSAVETIDFRVNEKRNYNDSLKEDVAKNKEFRIKKIHFLLLRDANDDFLSSHIKASCRELEPSHWENYVGKQQYIKENIFAYHWSEKTEKKDFDDFIESFNTLAKVRCHKSNWNTILVYLAVLTILSVVFNVSAGYLKDGLDNFFKNDIHMVNTNGNDKGVEKSGDTQ